MKLPSFQIVDLITSNEDRKFAPAGRMAAAIIEILQRQKECRPQDLSTMGFTSSELDEH